MHISHHYLARPTRLVLAAMLAFMLAVTMLPAQAASAATTTELVVNGDFSDGMTGWRTNNASVQKVSVAALGQNDSNAAVITPLTTGTAVINDQADTVPSSVAGTSYTLSAWVRASAPGAVGQIKAREVKGSLSKTHETRLKLSDTAWHKLIITFDTEIAGSALDVNVLFWGLTVGKPLYLNSVSLVGNDLTAPTAPPVVTPTPPTATPAPQPPVTGACTRPQLSGTSFGTSISTSGISAAEALSATDAIVGKIPVVRVFDPAMPMAWDKPRTAMLAGRDLVMSFRPMPQDVLSGKHDAELRAWFKNAPSNVTIYWSYIHEPEPMIAAGQFTADQYRRAWQHLDSIADSVCKSNMYATLILTGWTTNSASKRDWRTYYGGDDVIDVVAFDPYNGASNPYAVTSYPSAASIFDSVVKVANEIGKPYGIAETGSPKVPSDISGAQRAAWLTDVADFNRKHNALFVTYFNSSNDGEWRLLDAPSQKAWRAAVESSTN